MKRLLVGVLLAMLLPAGGDAVFAAGKNLKIAMVLWRGETDAEKGFRDGLKDNLQKRRDRTIAVDAVYLPADSFLTSNAKLIGAELRAARVKSPAADESYIDHGALMGVVPSYHQLGKAAATIVRRHQGGQKLQDMPVQEDRDPLLRINNATSRLLDVTIPAAVRKRAIVVE